MTIYLAYTAVFLLAAIPFLEVVGVIPIGVAAGLPALPVTVLAFLGNIATIWLLIFLMGQIKAWLQRREEEKGKSRPKKREERAARIWKRYGLPGLALVSPILIGSHLGAILAMTFGGTRKQITFWMTVSIFIWSVVMGFASHYGIDFLYRHTGREGFLIDLLDSN
ncbi:MAG: small multi-drug export protein [Eubacteriales bacterium]|nr:small multi-drug export protein [Bacillota bacterium]MBV1728231.1 small multi-drug export protein [Desulforudis sp.]MDZ4043403.1 small multi-drug export protein [Eubacteriales bacterium]MBU4532381.1 small multi-drug export protein [Bacillota bacterium]MBU4553663.1 small multi-drug export protein [Bacillota bacterium]